MMGHNPLEDTSEFDFPMRESGTRVSRIRPATVETDIAAVSHAGKVRTNNEDHYLVARAGRFLRTWMTNLPAGLAPVEFEEVVHAMFVADGMGGMAAGEVASREAIAHFLRLVLETPDWVFGIEEPEVEERLRRAVERFRNVNAALFERARRDPELGGMGTTLTLAWSLGRELLIAYVGDSRVYLLRGGTLHRLTRDHTRAQELADRGVIAQEDVATHRLRHILTQALGVWEGGGEPDLERIGLEDGDRLLVCSDGLTDMVDEATIAAELGPGRNASADRACQALLARALEQGGNDNVTIVVAVYHIAPAPAPTVGGDTLS
jgi:protein phosphatase